MCVIHDVYLFTIKTSVNQDLLFCINVRQYAVYHSTNYDKLCIMASALIMLLHTLMMRMNQYLKPPTLKIIFLLKTNLGYAEDNHETSMVVK